MSNSAAVREGLQRSLGLFDSTMIVAGSMIGVGIFTRVGRHGATGR